MKANTRTSHAWRTRVRTGLLLLLPIGLLGACGRHDDAKGTTVTSAVAVPVARPAWGAWPVEISVQGGVRASREVSVPALLRDTQLLSVDADVGDTVRAGQVLARLDTRFVASEIDQRRASLAEAEANLEASRLVLARSGDLAATGAISEQDILRYRTQVAIGEARLALAKSQLASSRMQGGDAMVRAPIDGVVSARTAVAGHVPALGEELFRIVSRNDCELVANVDTSVLPGLSPGADVTIDTAGAAAVPARVRAIAPSASPDRFNVAVYLRTQHECRWLPGTYVAGQVRIGMSPALSIARSALFLRDGFEYVMTADGRDRLHRVKVTTGRSQGNRIEILSGLGSGDRVVLAGAESLREETVVRPVPGDTDAVTGAAVAARAR